MESTYGGLSGLLGARNGDVLELDIEIQEVEVGAMGQKEREWSTEWILCCNRQLVKKSKVTIQNHGTDA